MNKNKLLDELTILLAKSLRHKIGSMVNPNELYAQKYSKDSEVLFKEAENISKQVNWNLHDKKEILEKLKKKLISELESCDFLKEKKFELVDSEIELALRKLGLFE